MHLTMLAQSVGCQQYTERPINTDGSTSVVLTVIVQYTVVNTF